ncbi:MAG: proton-conducting transporter membrane subunit [Microthrixaceae bacterium]
MESNALVFLVLAAPLGFVVAALAAAAHPGSHPVFVERLAAVVSWFGVAIAAGAAAAVAIGGSVQSTTLGAAGLGLSVRLDALSVIMFLMIALLAVVIVRFSTTYLDGDERQGTFVGRLAATIAAVELLVLAGNLATLVVAWIATSLALHQLLVFYRDRRGAVVAARKKFIIARIGDVFLIGAAVLLYAEFGTGNLQEIFDGAREVSGWALGTVELAALFVVAAAILKSAQFPTHGWLVEVMETPTPVSALLHAGILNAGPFIAMRMAFVIDGANVATTLLIVAGATTAVFASVVLLTQPSVKVALGYSSAAHMGFMLMICGLGVYPAALLHLVAHSFYKAHAFLSSGSAIDEARAAKVRLPRRLGSPVRVAASAAVALAIYLPFALLWGIDLAGDWILVAVGLILVIGTTQLVAPALDSVGPVAGTLRAGFLALCVTLAFFSLEGAAHALLKGTVPEDLIRTPVHFVLIAAVLVTFGGVVLSQIVDPTRPASARRRRLAVHFRNGFYANALFDRVVGALRTSTVAPAPAAERL